MPRSASMWAFIVSSIRRTSACSTIADSPVAPGARPCRRSAAYATACW